MIGLAASLLGSSLGRKAVLWGLVAASVVLVIWRIYSAGQSAERARQVGASLENLRNRIKVDDEITKLPPDKRRERLLEWVRD